MGRILYLDDDEALAGLVVQQLARLGHSMLACSNATQALRAFSDSPDDFDLVLTDMSMPGTSGLEFAREVLSVKPDAHVVIASGCEDPNWAQLARSVGVRAVLLKPFRANEFAQALDELLSR